MLEEFEPNDTIVGATVKGKGCFTRDWFLCVDNGDAIGVKNFVDALHG
jgi:hypothetical protein